MNLLKEKAISEIGVSVNKSASIRFLLKLAALLFVPALWRCSPPVMLAGSFTPGNIAVLRLGDGVQTLGNTGNTIFIDEYTVNGSFVQSFPIPDSGGPALIQSGAATSEGFLMLSPNRRWLCFAGYNTARPYSNNVTASPSASVPRGIGTLDAAGSYSLAAATTNQFNGVKIRGGATDGTNNFWGAGGSSGTYYFGFASGASMVQSS